MTTKAAHLAIFATALLFIGMFVSLFIPAAPVFSSLALGVAFSISYSIQLYFTGYKEQVLFFVRIAVIGIPLLLVGLALSVLAAMMFNSLLAPLIMWGLVYLFLYVTYPD